VHLSNSSDFSSTISDFIVISPEVDISFFLICGETAATLVGIDVSEPLRTMDDELLCLRLYSSAILVSCAESDVDEYKVELEEEDKLEVIAGFETETDLSSLKTMLNG
jgi:hypothetical protein